MIAMFKHILKKEGIKAKSFSKRIGLGYNSYRSMISTGQVPRWVKAFVFGYGVGKKSATNSHEFNEVKDDFCLKCGMESYLVNVMGCRDENCPEAQREGVRFVQLTPEEIKELDTEGLYIDPNTLKDEEI